MLELNRRCALKTLAAAAAGSLLPRGAAAVGPDAGGGAVPLVHISDLYHPPQDPDDHFDLATVAALPELDLRAVVLDVTKKFLVGKPEGWDVPRDPGFVPVTQLNYLTGRSIPVAMGPVEPLRDATDAARDRPRREQAGIELLLETLRRSEAPVTISMVGSGRVLAAAFLRAPQLVRAKTRVVLLNAGATGGAKREWNVGLDPAAYIALWRSGLPIDWYPCATDRGAFDPAAERGTYWKASHAELLQDLPAGLRGWFGYALTGATRGDIIRALSELGQGATWQRALAGDRNLWATVSLVTAAGRVLARTEQGWRFVPAQRTSGLEIWPWRLDPIRTVVDDDARVQWKVVKPSTTHRLFGRRPGVAYARAMAEALNGLLREISC